METPAYNRTNCYLVWAGISRYMLTSNGLEVDVRGFVPNLSC